jgi:uncharacterized protein YkwD
MRRLLLMAAVALSLAAAGPAVAADPLLAPQQACPAQSSAGLAPPAQRAAMGCMVRWARRTAGLHRARLSRRLARSAQLKANLIARCGTLTHAPCGLPWDGVFSRVGFRGLTFENIAAGSGSYGTARGAMAMWLASPGHRDALLNRQVTVFGVGVRLHALVDGAQMSVWTLHLGRPS